MLPKSIHLRVTILDTFELQWRLWIVFLPYCEVLLAENRVKPPLLWCDPGVMSHRANFVGRGAAWCAAAVGAVFEP